MSIARKYFGIVLLVLMFVSVSSVYGGGPPQNTHVTVRETIIPWVIPADQCSSLPAGLSVSGTGQRIATTNTKVNANGSMEIIINDLVVGDAQDSDGGTYHYKYTNHSIQNVPVSGPAQFSMTDSFVMNGSGAAGHLSVGFVMRWLVVPNDTSFPPIGAQIISTHGDPFHCDPL
jgi:hypothetical protein